MSALVALLAPLTSGCAMNGGAALVSPTSPGPPRPQGFNWLPSQGALQIGLDSLRSAVLPHGVREIRIEVDCDLCTPDYLVRIVAGPGALVKGEAWILQAHFVRQPGDTEGARIDRGYEQGTRAQRSSLRCSSPERSRDDHVDACRIGLPLQWRNILLMLDTSGVLRSPLDTGYSPMPPTYVPSITKIDSATGRKTVVRFGGFPGCGDIGGQSMGIEILDGDRYRTAAFWCLEQPGPVGGEQYRAAAVRAELMRLLTPRTARQPR